MDHSSAQYPTYCPRVGVMAIGRYLLRLMTNSFPGSLEESLGCLHVSLLREPRVYQVTITIDCSIQIVPLAIHFHIGFIGVPGTACFSLAPCSQLLSDQRGEASLP